MRVFRFMDHFARTSSFFQRNDGHVSGAGNISQGLRRRRFEKATALFAADPAACCFLSWEVDFIMSDALPIILGTEKFKDN